MKSLKTVVFCASLAMMLTASAEKETEEEIKEDVPWSMEVQTSGGMYLPLGGHQAAAGMAEVGVVFIKSKIKEGDKSDGGFGVWLMNAPSVKCDDGYSSTTRVAIGPWGRIWYEDFFCDAGIGAAMLFSGKEAFRHGHDKETGGWLIKLGGGYRLTENCFFEIGGDYVVSWGWPNPFFYYPGVPHRSTYLGPGQFTVSAGLRYRF